MIIDVPTQAQSYEEFLRAKLATARSLGFDVSPEEINPKLKPFNRDIVRWALHGGRRAIFAAFGLHKTAMQIEMMRIISRREPRSTLIVLPLGVRQEFKRDADNLFQNDFSVRLKFIRTADEIEDDRTIYLTNYESVRDGKLNVSAFSAVSLDEASCLRGFGGTKTFREFMRLFENNPEIKYKFVATATPSPNEYIELLAYAAFLEIMDVGQAKTRFFKRDSTKADSLTIHPHKEKEFYMWMSTWAFFIQRPSDLGYSDEGYDLPPLDVRWHEVKTNHYQAGVEKSGQHKLLKNAAIGIQDASREKRESLPERIRKMLELRAVDPDAHRILWHDLEIERAAIELNTHAATVYGSQDLDEREQIIIDFSDGKIQELAGKPQMLGSGCNFQRHCAWAIFLGIGFKFNDFIQAVHRLRRFLQTKSVRIDLIYTEAEREIRMELMRKWEQHNQLTEKMSQIIREYGLVNNAMQNELSRSLHDGLSAYQEVGNNFVLHNDDAVFATRRMEENSFHLILSSIPFSTQYEYTPSYNDFGHTDSNDHFYEQMDFLTPELFRVLKPGRVAAIHVKDRIVPGGMTGLGFQTVYPFHAEAIRHFTKHGFSFLGMKTIVTDVVRENNQTYRLGWTEQCKDGSRMGAGMPEYLLLFRKPPSDSSNGYADEPVVKDKQEYSRSRWQVDAHGYMRSSGNRLLSPADLVGLKHERIFKLFREHSLNSVYNFEEHVKLGEVLEEKELLPVTFMLLQPQSWHQDVWTDITRMRTLNGAQSAAGREMHLCPMQFDIADRVITQFTMEGETVFDPFGGLGTVPYCALKLKRRGVAVELNGRYFFDAVNYCKSAEQQVESPSLFDLEEVIVD
ncbi:MAG TPA: DNA methyltransferase [Terriglobales bacterium]